MKSINNGQIIIRNSDNGYGYKSKIKKLYNTEFEDAILTIFHDLESVNLSKIINRIKFDIDEYIKNKPCDEKNIQMIVKIQNEWLMDIYYQKKKIMLKFLNDYKKNPNIRLTEFLFRKHCKNCPEVAIHSCMSRLIIFRENDETKYVICTECKVVFLKESLMLYCKNCSCEYYSSIVGCKEDINLNPATWENYHCGNLLPEQMRCLKCKDFVFINNEDNFLNCIKCKFKSDPKKIVWICVFCKAEFQSKAKIYNILEFKMIKTTIKETLLSKIPARPDEIACSCKDVFSRTFRHKKNCQGDLFFGNLKGKSVIVCSKCKCMTEKQGFMWTCPKCEKIYTCDRKNPKMTIKNFSNTTSPQKTLVNNNSLENELNKEISGISAFNKKICSTDKKDRINSERFDRKKTIIEGKGVKRLEYQRNHSVSNYKLAKISKVKFDDTMNFMDKLMPIKEEDYKPPSSRLMSNSEYEKSFDSDEKFKQTINFASIESEKNSYSSANNNNTKTADSLNKTNSRKNLINHISNEKSKTGNFYKSNNVNEIELKQCLLRESNISPKNNSSKILVNPNIIFGKDLISNKFKKEGIENKNNTPTSMIYLSPIEFVNEKKLSMIKTPIKFQNIKTSPIHLPRENQIKINEIPNLKIGQNMILPIVLPQEKQFKIVDIQKIDQNINSPRPIIKEEKKINFAFQNLKEDKNIGNFHQISKLDKTKIYHFNSLKMEQNKEFSTSEDQLTKEFSTNEDKNKISIQLMYKDQIKKISSQSQKEDQINTNPNNFTTENISSNSPKEITNNIKIENISTNSPKDNSNTITKENISSNSPKDNHNTILTENILSNSPNDNPNTITTENISSNSPKNNQNTILTENILSNSPKDNGNIIGEIPNPNFDKKNFSPANLTDYKSKIIENKLSIDNNYKIIDILVPNNDKIKTSPIQNLEKIRDFPNRESEEIKEISTEILEQNNSIQSPSVVSICKNKIKNCPSPNLDHEKIITQDSKINYISKISTTETSSNNNEININVKSASIKKESYENPEQELLDIEEEEKIEMKLNEFNIEDYKIISTIGEGSFGVIYCAENQFTKERYAMKKIILNNDEDLRMFMMEFEMVNKYPHENILKILGLCNKVLDFSTKVLYIKLEQAISDWDKEIKTRNERNEYYLENDLVIILKQIVAALCFLQEKGISHRDVKPQNILIFPNNIFKVADFGEAKEVKQANRQIETLRGTELYMSPILFTTLRTTNKNNVQHNSYKSDVFSLGYCFLYAATLSFKILYEIRHLKNPKTVSHIIRNYLCIKYSKKFSDLLSRMLEINETIRFDFISLNKYIHENF